ncbi:MAG: ATP-binding cassette domain-containing protein [Planctomycetota bacterium]|nr:ATP-binding cassette domain-containing protein [Planctomycetota bacterium]
MLELAHVRKSYDGGQTWAVEDISFRAEPGELIVLLGGSGCGKTTTLKMINRLVEPTSGVISIDGRDILELDPVVLRRTIGYVIQGAGLFPHMTIGANVAVVPKLLGWDEDRTQARVTELLELVGLDPAEFAGRLPRELSGGQRQRIGVARALAAKPSIMLLDEPFGALDPVTRDNIQGEFKRIQAEVGFAAVLVTHDMTEALLMATRIVVIRDGIVAQEGTPEELLNSPADAFVETLISTPRRQAHQLEELIHEGGEA